MMNNTSHNGMPIRLLSDGHTLSNGGSTLPKAAPMEVLLCTYKTTLVPRQHLATEDVASHLRNVSLSPTPNECVVVSDERDGIVAVMAIDRTLYEQLRATQSDIHYVSPLLDGNISERGCTISFYGKTLYIRVVDETLRFAEAMEVATDIDILYYIERVNEVYDLYNMYTRARGEHERLNKNIKKKFKNLVCE